MSPHDFEPYKEVFDESAAMIGWYPKTIKVQHERDECCSWEEDIYVDYDGRRLFAVKDITKEFVQSITDLVWRLQ